MFELASVQPQIGADELLDRLQDAGRAHQLPEQRVALDRLLLIRLTLGAAGLWLSSMS